MLGVHHAHHGANARHRKSEWYPPKGNVDSGDASTTLLPTSSLNQSRKSVWLGQNRKSRVSMAPPGMGLGVGSPLDQPPPPRGDSLYNQLSFEEGSMILSDFVNVFHQLLVLHELKLCVQLLDCLKESDIGDSNLPFDGRQLKEAFQECEGLNSKGRDGYHALVQMGLASAPPPPEMPAANIILTPSTRQPDNRVSFAVGSQRSSFTVPEAESRLDALDEDETCGRSAELGAYSSAAEDPCGVSKMQSEQKLKRDDDSDEEEPEIKTRRRASAMAMNCLPVGGFSASSTEPPALKARLSAAVFSGAMEMGKTISNVFSSLRSHRVSESENSVRRRSSKRSSTRSLRSDHSCRSDMTDDLSDSDDSNDDEDVEEFCERATALANEPASKSWWKCRWGRKIPIMDQNAPLLARPTSRIIIHPNNPARLCWDLLAFLVIILEAVTIPLAMCFDVEPPVYWFWTSTVFFAIDIALGCTTGYFADGLLVMRQSLILRRYLTTFFVLDVASTVPWELAVEGEHDSSSTASLAKAARFVKLVRFIRLLRLVKVKDLLARLEDLIPSSELGLLLSFVKMLGFFALLAHWCCCVWGFIGNPSKVGHESALLPPHDPESCEPAGACEPGVMGSPWQRRYAMQDHSADEKYLSSLVFATSILTGGEWNFSPGYVGERVYVVIMMVFSFLVMATVLSEIVVLFERISADTSELSDTLRAMKAFMNNKSVPLPLQAKIKRYLEFQHRSQKDGSGQEYLEFVIQQLSPWLRLELTEVLNRGILIRHPFFQTLPPRVVKRLCSLAQVVLYAPGDIVMQRGYRASCMCFIVKGNLKILTPVSMRKSYSEAGQAGDKGVDHSIMLTAPSWIGDLCLFQETVRTSTVLCLTHSELLIVTKDHLGTLMDDFPKCQEVYEEFAQLVRDQGATATTCVVCGGLGHTGAHCPKLKSNLDERRIASEACLINHRSQREHRVSSRPSTKSESIFAGGSSFRKVLSNVNQRIIAKVASSRVSSTSQSSSMSGVCMPSVESTSGRNTLHVPGTQAR